VESTIHCITFVFVNVVYIFVWDPSTVIFKVHISIIHLALLYTRIYYMDICACTIYFTLSFTECVYETQSPWRRYGWYLVVLKKW